MKIEKALSERGLTLPTAAAPAANYLPFTLVDDLIHVSGQISADENGLICGKLGADIDTAAGAKAAERCGLALIAQLRVALDGELSRFLRVVKLTGYVNATDDFTEHPEVINGCSDLFVAVFGPAGRHARAAVGMSSLPRGVAVEIEATFQVRP